MDRSTIIILGCLIILNIGICNAQFNGQFNPLSLNERQLDDLSLRYGVSSCWNYIKNSAFGGRYTPAKAQAYGPSLRPTIQRLARSGPCQYELPNSPLRRYL